MKEVLRTIVGSQNTDSKGKIVIGKLTKTTERINGRGDVIDPVTKQVIKSNNEKE